MLLLLPILVPSLLVGTRASCRSLNVRASFNDGGLKLPWGRRNLAAEAAAAALRLTVRMGRHPDDAPPVTVRPLRVLACLTGGLGQQICSSLAVDAAVAGQETTVEMVAAEVSEITTGRLCGSSWLKPMAMRVLGADGAAVAQFTLFGALVPNLIAPTALLRPLDTAEGSMLRLMHDLHLAQETSTEPQLAEVRAIQLFTQLIDVRRGVEGVQGVEGGAESGGESSTAGGGDSGDV